MEESFASERLSVLALSDLILEAPRGGLLCVDGIDLAGLRALFEDIELPPHASRLLFLPLASADSSEALAENIIAALADIALKLWPVWYRDVSFPGRGVDTLARLAVIAVARRVAAGMPGVLPAWVEAAALLALDGRPPRVPQTPAGTQLDQLARLIGPDGLVLAVDIPRGALSSPRAEALVHGLEWVARHLRGAMVVVFPEPPGERSPFDRIRHGVRRFAADVGGTAPAAPGADAHAVQRPSPGPEPEEPWLLPWRGRPHPLSAVEQRLARLIEADEELAPLFGFNIPVETVRGSRPRVDLLWAEGRLVVELDGYADHGTRAAFLRDRHRDFELRLSGYAVLRLPNDEIAQDCWLALEKIRDLVRQRRQVLLRER